MNTRTVYFLFFLLSAYSLSAQQTYTFDKALVYKLSYNPDTTNRERALTELMELLVNDSLSIFRSVMQAGADSVNKQYYLNGENRINTGGRIRYNLIKTPEKIIYLEYIHNFKDELLSYTESTSIQDWNISDEEKSINGWECQAAELRYGGRLWKAYFAPEIPIMDGPYKFMNLPGLIVKITSDDGTWDFTLESFNQNVNKQVEINQYPTRKILVMDKKAFYKESDYFQENRLFIEESTGKMGFRTEEEREGFVKRFKDYVRSNNNKLEKLY